MLRSPKPLLFGLFLSLLASPLAQTEETSKEKPKKTDSSKTSEDKSGKPNLAIPLHQPVKGLHLPFYDLTGRIKMQFDAETANRTTDNLVELTTLKVETFDEKSQRDMLVNFQQATYDLSSSVISSKENVEVRRTDFVLTGVGMEFDTKKKFGRVFSQIRMEIFNRSADTAPPTPTPNGP